MGEMIQFKRPDGRAGSGYLAVPSHGEAAPGVVVVQEWWGLQAQIKGVADRFAEAGFRALAPDLYEGRIARDAGEASQMMNGLDFVDAAQQDVRGAVRHLKMSGGKVAVTGFCMGGAITLIAAVHVPECDAAVCFYGIPPEEAADPRSVRVPFQGHFADQDGWCNPKAVNDLEKGLASAAVPAEIHRYAAQHAFFNEQRPEVHDPAAATLAWERSIKFLRKHLG
ncbi:MAG: dienelactone hydrolase family protein [Deltaproteobacteria bacterium]|nr:dienelactone hydrolase family protein [Deltaproteobacteria bacterium]